MENMDQEKTNIIREHLLEEITKTYSKLNGGVDIGNTPLSEVLDVVIESQLIPWVSFKSRKSNLENHEIAFSIGFKRYINQFYMEEETLKDIGQLLGWTHKKQMYCFNGSGIYVSRNDLLRFLFPSQEDYYYYMERYPSQESTI